MGKTKALFIGNSYTYCNKMPWIVSKLAESAGRQLHVDMVTKGGVSFAWHFDNPDTLKAIQDDSWDFIVFQNHSLGAIQSKEKMDQYGAALIKMAQDAGAQAVLYMTWARQHAPETQGQITDAYASLGKATGAKVAPVGEAWKKVLGAEPKLALHTNDKSHPNPLGSYLTACVFYATFYNESPEGLTGHIDVDGETIISIECDKARHVQVLAWETTREFPRQ